MTYRFDNKFVYAVKVLETDAQVFDMHGVRFEYLDGLSKGTQDVTIKDYIYTMPNDKDRLVADIDGQIDYLERMKKSVILERTVL